MEEESTSHATVESNASDRIKLNVGGKLFETTLSTIRSDGPDSLLYDLSNRSSNDPNPVFIDRDPEIFSVLLSLLRTNHLPSTALRFSKQELADEANFYGIDSHLRAATSPPPFSGIDASIVGTVRPASEGFPSTFTAADNGSVWIAHGGQLSSYDWNLIHSATVRTHLDEIKSICRVWPEIAAVGTSSDAGLHFYNFSGSRHVGSVHWSDPTDPRIFKARVNAITASENSGSGQRSRLSELLPMPVYTSTKTEGKRIFRNMTNAFSLVAQQYKALLKKNVLLSWRSKRSILLQLLSPIIFIFLIFAVDKAIKAQTSTTSSYKSVTNPISLPSPPIPPCERKFFVKLPCYDFVWSGDNNPKFHTIVSRIISNNPGRPIPISKVKSFRDKGEVDKWLFDNPMQCPGAIHFREKNASVISYGIQTNSTSVQKRGRFEDPTFSFQLPLQLAAEREIARFLIGDTRFKWNVFLKEFAHPAMSPFSAVGTIGPAFFLAIAMFNFVLQMSSLVTEKELKLRQAMTVMGLYDSAYWLSWLTWETVVTVLSSILIVLSGMMFQFDFFLKNNFAVLFFLFFLFELNMTGLAFMLSAFIRKSSSATTVGFSIFIVGFVTQLVVQAGFPYTDSISVTFQNLWSLFPPNPFAQGLSMLSNAVSTPEDNGLSWTKRGECADYDVDCVITINDIYKWLLATFFLWFVLALYFDNIIPNAMGVRKSVLYFLNPYYWTGNGVQKVKEGGVCSCLISAHHEDNSTADDEDVLEEENAVKLQQTQGAVDTNVAVQIHGIKKTYSGTYNIGCCCKCKKSAPYHALKGLWVNFTKDQLFCLLGPNGAGKTTAINCLTGITPVTDGDALIYGHSIRNSTGMSNIRKLIGVCPQFDILWDALSGQEHLELFASIKGLSPASIKSITQTSLAEVRLMDAAKVRSGSYSGGMKRRLSVAIALIGDPKLVILDEPTTGMDPITRRHVWDIIENAKKGRAIVLTTHSMEEADILSDRIGIMAKGKLRCIGTSIRLKSRFGTGFIANISFSGNNNENSPVNGDAVSTRRHHEAVKQFFKNRLDVVPKEENNNFLTYVIPHERETLLTDFFSELQDREEEFGISDIQLGLTTLEEVFLNIAKQAELESAAAEGSLVTLTLTSGESVEIPIGARFVGIPGTESSEYPTGFMVEVYWEQDDTGALCVAGHSQKAPIPQNIQLPSTATARQRRSGSVHGVVIDPSQISSVNFQ